MTAPHRYGAGLPRIGDRPLDEADLARVRQHLRAATAWLGLGFGCSLTAALGFVLDPGSAWLLPIALASLAVAVHGSTRMRIVMVVGWLAQAAFALVATVRPEARPAHPLLVLAVQVATSAVAIGFLAARVHDGVRLLSRRRALRHDLRDGVAQRCEGALHGTGLPRVFRTLQRRGEFDDLGQRHGIEILERSGLVLRADGHVPRRPVFAPLHLVAPSVPHALRVALPDDLATIASPSTELRRRSLTEAERSELERHAHAMRRIPWQALAVLPSAGLAAWQFFDGSWTSWQSLAAVVVHALAGASLLHTVQRFRAGGRLRADRTLRWVVTVADHDALSGSAARLEMLPISRMAWTEHGHPASWRLDS